MCLRAPEVRARRGRGREGRVGREEEKWEMKWVRVSWHAKRESHGRSAKPSSVPGEESKWNHPSSPTAPPLPPPLFNITNLTQQRLIFLFSSFLLLSSHLLVSSLSLPSSAVPRAADPTRGPAFICYFPLPSAAHCSRLRPPPSPSLMFSPHVLGTADGPLQSH